jgi:hypothetical protein
MHGPGDAAAGRKFALCGRSSGEPASLGAQLGFPSLPRLFARWFGRAKDAASEAVQMIRQLCNLGSLRPWLWAVLIVCGLPALAAAESLAFRNECTAPMVIQAVSIGPGGAVRRDRPYLLNPGDATPGITLQGDKIITIYDARVPNRVLFQGAIPAGREDLRFGVVPDPMPGRVRIELRRVPPPRPGRR